MSALKSQLKLILPGLSKEANVNQDKEIRRHLYLVKAVCASPRSVRQVCESRGVSSDQFYLWGNRLLKAKVLSSLKSKSKKPKRSPSKTKTRIERKIWAMRKAEPSHGPERISFYLKELFNIVCPPATVYKVLLRLKLISKTYSKKLTKRHHKRYRKSLPGYMQMDVKYVPYRIDGRQYYEFNIVDHCTTWRLARVYRNITQENTVHFLNEVVRTCPFPIFEIQTDNGNEFTDKYRHSLTAASGAHPMDQWCKLKDIPHRLIPIGQKELNGKVENTHKQDDREFYAGAEDTSFEKIELRMRSYIERWNGSRATKALGWQTPNQCVDAGFIRALVYLIEMQARYAPEATAAYSLNRQGDAFLPIQKPQPPPRKKQKPKKLTALDRYLQWLEWNEKKEARALAPLLPVMSKIFSDFSYSIPDMPNRTYPPNGLAPMSQVPFYRHVRGGTSMTFKTILAISAFLLTPVLAQADGLACEVQASLMAQQFSSEKGETLNFDLPSVGCDGQKQCEVDVVDGKKLHVYTVNFQGDGTCQPIEKDAVTEQIQSIN